MSNRIPDGTYVYAAPGIAPWEQTAPQTQPTTTLTMTLLEQPILQRIEALEREAFEYALQAIDDRAALVKEADDQLSVANFYATLEAARRHVRGEE